MSQACLLIEYHWRAPALAMRPPLFLLLPEIILSYKGLSIACPAKICREKPKQDGTGKKFVAFVVTRHLKIPTGNMQVEAGEVAYCKVFAHKQEF